MKTADLLGMSRKTLWEKTKKLKLGAAHEMGTNPQGRP
jgi:DNA-binding NtrC family response regulator